MVYALDTGFFYALLTASDERVRAAWRAIGREEAQAVVSIITVFELSRHGLRGSLPRGPVEDMLRDLPHVCSLVPVDGVGQAQRAARLSHGTGLSMADALVLEAATGQGASALFTSDRDFEAYSGDLEIVRI